MWRQYPHRLAWAGCDRQAKKSRSAGHLTVTFGMRVVLCNSIWAPSFFELVGGVQMAARQDHRHRYKCHPPRKFNYRIMWADGDTQGPRQARCRQLRLRHHAACNSWVILQQKA